MHSESGPVGTLVVVVTSPSEHIPHVSLQLRRTQGERLHIHENLSHFLAPQLSVQAAAFIHMNQEKLRDTINVGFSSNVI